MKIKCKKLNAVISERTCIARYAKAIKQNNGSLTWGNTGGGIDESLSKCAECKTGKKLYKKALKEGTVPAYHTRIMRRSKIDINHAYLQSRFGIEIDREW